MSIIVEELFDYPIGVLQDYNGGTGWTDKWYTDNYKTEAPEVVAGNLTYSGISNGDPSNARKLKAYNEGTNYAPHYFRRSFTPLSNTAGTIYWFTFTVASNLSKGGSTLIFDHLTYDVDGLYPQILMGITGNLLNAEAYFHGALLYTGSSSYISHDIVYKITMSGSPSIPIGVDCYSDVDTSKDPDTWTPKVTTNEFYVTQPITKLEWNTNTLASSASDDLFYMDNIRIATTSYESGGYPETQNVNFFQFMRKRL